MISSTVFSQENLSAHDFFSIQDSAEQVVVLDVRPYEEYSEERIPGALYAGEKKVLMELIKNYESCIPIFVYCEYGKRSKTVMILLKKQGFERIYNLEAGYKDWKRRGFPVDTEKID
ncbi:rhodanese-like domain-containing protein [Marinilabilia sp.]|uniref:rhodanese-like domain-containing protein n=1 Tax=Marinilabilia sp. TaxID=2021252 RepID=UPI0025B9947D|nr:rhodanese-like domain-containing protein [Marinilabilia sp.]